MKIVNYLKGKKTFIVAILGAITFALSRLGYITPDTEAQAYILLGITGTVTMRAAISK